MPKTPPQKARALIVGLWKRRIRDWLMELRGIKLRALWPGLLLLHCHQALIDWSDDHERERLVGEKPTATGDPTPARGQISGHKPGDAANHSQP